MVIYESSETRYTFKLAIQQILQQAIHYNCTGLCLTYRSIIVQSYFTYVKRLIQNSKLS